MLDDTFQQAQAHYAAGRHQDAARLLEQLLAGRPNDVNALNLAGVVTKQLHNYALAEKLFRQAMRVEPRYPSPHYNLGCLLIDMGELAGAETHLRQAIALQPDFASAHGMLAKIVRHNERDADIVSLEALADNPSLDAGSAMHVGYGLGKALDDIGDFDAAFRSFAKANALRRSLYPYDVRADIATLDRCIKLIDQDFLNECRGDSVTDRSMIFIVGMPRSGTSLIEQVLASHPDIFGAGELPTLFELRSRLENATRETFPACIRSAPKGALRELAQRYLHEVRGMDRDGHRSMTDKMPHNFLHIGLIHLAMPGAKIIHCRRHPLDTCLSLYMNYFEDSNHLYSCDLEDLATYHLRYQALMAHWESLLPNVLHTIDYEDIVADLETSVRSLLDYCELPFDAKCLDFHLNRRAVRTNSTAQVQQPLYRSSVQKWQRYEAWLEPLISRLGTEKSK